MILAALIILALPVWVANCFLLVVLVLSCAWALGMRWAARDKKDIDAQNAKPNPVDLDHKPLLFWRITVLVIGMTIVWAWLKWTGGSMWLLIPYCVMAWGVFAMTHRRRLNGLRGESWWYMGSRLGERTDKAARYDTLWHGLAAGLSNSGDALGRRQPYYPDKLPARLAYVFEATLTTLSLAWVVVNQLK